MDLNKLDVVQASDKGAILHLMNPFNPKEFLFEDKDEKIPMTLSLIGKDSRRYRETVKRQRDALDTSRSFKKNKMDMEEEGGIDLIVAGTMGWTGMVLDGKKLEFSAENTKMLYTRFPWMLEQAAEFISRRANFLGK